jgi:hypothetical protein
MRDKRIAERHPYASVEKIGPIRDGRMPRPRDFVSVRCADLSRNGFAFISDELPPFHSLVVALGVRGKPIFLTAAVMHSTPVERDGKPVYHVGCEFNGRVVWSEKTQQFVRNRDLESAATLLAQAHVE